MKHRVDGKRLKRWISERLSEQEWKTRNALGSLFCRCCFIFITHGYSNGSVATAKTRYAIFQHLDGGKGKLKKSRIYSYFDLLAKAGVLTVDPVDMTVTFTVPAELVTQTTDDAGAAAETVKTVAATTESENTERDPKYQSLEWMARHDMFGALMKFGPVTVREYLILNGFDANRAQRNVSYLLDNMRRTEPDLFRQVSLDGWTDERG